MPGLSEILILDSVDSTNSYALSNFDGFGHGALIVARSQSAGRGRKGRVWVSPPSVNVYASLILKGLKFLPAQASWLGSLAALETLRNRGPRLPLRVKWPNDVLCGGLKIAGVLCETKAGAAGGIVIGIGVNINMSKEELSLIDAPATSLYAETGRLGDTEAFAQAMGEAAMKLYGIAERDGIKTLHAMWSAETLLEGSIVEALLDSGCSFSGRVEKLRLDGTLSLRLEDGSLLNVSAGEISLRERAVHAPA